jgi:hypothetical protein
LGIPIKKTLYTSDITQNWSSRFTGAENYNVNGFNLSGSDETSYSLSFTNQTFDASNNSSWVYRMGVAVLQKNNPWINVNGMFGNINRTTMYDFNATRFWNNGFFGQLGAIQSMVDFTPGLVEKISPMWLGYAVGGWKGNGLTVYGGLQPTAFSGNIKVKLPTSVDTQGTMHYTTHSVAIRNQAVSFVGSDYSWKIGKYFLSIGAVINDQKAYQAKATFKVNL